MKCKPIQTKSRKIRNKKNTAFYLILNLIDLKLSLALSPIEKKTTEIKNNAYNDEND